MEHKKLQRGKLMPKLNFSKDNFKDAKTDLKTETEAKADPRRLFKHRAVMRLLVQKRPLQQSASPQVDIFSKSLTIRLGNLDFLLLSK